MKKTILFTLIAALISSIALAGEIGGIKNYSDVVDGNKSVSYNLILKTNELLTIKLSADNDSNIDCYLHNWSGEILAKDTSPASSCFISYTPKKQGKYIFLIMNSGDKSNNYQFTTDSR